MNRALVLSLGLLAATGPAAAQDVAAAVRALYAPTVWNPLESDDLSKLTGPALALFERNAAQSAESGEMGCIDFVVTVGGQDFDEEEVARSIRTEVAGITSEGDAQVEAHFRSFPGEEADQEIRWTMREVDGVWKVADIESPADNWILSTFPCGG